MTHCRPLVATDYEDARALYQTLSTGSSLPKEEASRDAFDAILKHNGTTVLGLENDGTIISMATLHVLPNITYDARPYALIENVATLDEFQGQGHGRTLMNAVAEFAWSKGVYKIMLLTNQSRGAAEFYARLGYSADEKYGMVLRKTPPL